VLEAVLGLGRQVLLAILVAVFVIGGWLWWSHGPAAVAGGIEGRIVDVSGQPIAGARVQVQGTEFVTQTSEEGSFLLEALPPGEYWLVVEAAGQGGLRVPLEVAAGEMLSAGDLAVYASGP
jgi:hypothetical protein